MRETEVKQAEAAAPTPAPIPTPKGGRGRRWSRRLKWLIPLMLLLALAGGGWYYMDQARQRQAAQPNYTDYTVGRGDVAVTVGESSVLEPLDRREVRSLVAGTILTAQVEVGQSVTAGDLLYTLDATEAADTLEQREFSLRRARQAAAEAGRRIADLTVAAPADGLVTAVSARDGDMVAADGVLATLADADSLAVTLPFFEADAQNIFAGQSALVTLEGTGEQLVGRVDRVATGTYVGGAGVRLVNVVVHFENPGAVAPGSRATAQVGDYACHMAGDIEYAQIYEVRAKRAGELSGFTLIPGDRVSAGVVLAQVLDPDAQSALAAAELTLTEAEAAVRRGQARLQDYEVRAPIAGTVVSKTAEAGDKLSATTLGGLAEIADLSALRFPLEVDEMDVAAIRPGQPVTVTADACPGEEYQGRVTSVEPVGSASGGVTTFAVWVAVEDYGALRPGMNVEAQVVTARAENAIIVPQAALLEGDRVMVKTGNGYQPVEVETGLTDGAQVEILGGLPEGSVIGLPPEGLPVT